MADLGAWGELARLISARRLGVTRIGPPGRPALCIGDRPAPAVRQHLAGRVGCPPAMLRSLPTAPRGKSRTVVAWAGLELATAMSQVWRSLTRAVQARGHPKREIVARRKRHRERKLTAHAAILPPIIRPSNPGVT